MKLILIIALLGLTACKEEIQSTINEDKLPGVASKCQQNGDINYSIQSHDFLRSDYPVSNIMDNDGSTFMTTDPLTVGDTRFLTLNLLGETCVYKISLWNLYYPEHLLGDVKVYTSSDGVNFTQVDYILALDAVFLDDKTDIIIDDLATYIKFEFEYYGEGAFGATPSFYLSELDVLGD